jgi:hypothetical protein
MRLLIPCHRRERARETAREPESDQEGKEEQEGLFKAKVRTRWVLGATAQRQEEEGATAQRQEEEEARR